MATDRTVPGTGTPQNAVTRRSEQFSRETNLGTLKSLMGRLEGAIALTGSNATGLAFDFEPGRSQWIFSVHPSNLPAYGPESKTLSAHLIVNDNSGIKIAESIDASVTHGHGKEGIIGTHFRESSTPQPRSWNEQNDIGRLRNLFDAYGIPPINPGLGPDDADGARASADGSRDAQVYPTTQTDTVFLARPSEKIVHLELDDDLKS